MLGLIRKVLGRSSTLVSTPNRKRVGESQSRISSETIKNQFSFENTVNNLPPELLDHLIHAMRMSNKLNDVTPQQVDNIMFALRAAGLLDRHPDIYNCTFNGDGLVSFHNCDFLQDPLFRESYALGKATRSWGGDIEFRAYVFCWAANRAKTLEGDYVECGVNRGGYSRAAMNYMNFKDMPDKKFYLLDTYYGFPEELRPLAVQDHLDKYRECYDDVCETFKPFQNAIVVRGKIPDTLTQVPSEKVCFLSIDMNCAEPEIQAAEYFWDKLVSGAIVVLDDYANGAVYERQKQAFDQFAQRKGVQILTLPTGQGLIFKP